MKIKSILSACLVMCGLMSFADGESVSESEIEFLEFVETTGTQWIDTGLKLNFRRSVYRLNVRFLEFGVSNNDGKREVSFAGLTDIKDSLSGYDAGKYLSFAAGLQYKATPASEAGYKLTQWTSGSNASGYIYPTLNSFDNKIGWEFENNVAVIYFNGSIIAHNDAKNPPVKGRPIGYNDGGKIDQESQNTFYLGAVNNAGEGCYDFGINPPKMQWYGAKFWTDGELIGDFVPARQNGVVGFYDKVSGGFYPSRSEDPFIAPQHIKWIGGNDGDLTNDANWEGGAKPSTVQQIAVFPAGTTNRCTITDHAVLKNLGGIKLVGEDTLLWLTNINESTESYTPLYGKGTYRLQKTDNDSKGIKLYGNSCLFEGLFDLTNAYVYPYNPSAIGVHGLSKARYYASMNQIRLYFQDMWRSHMDLTIGPVGQFVFTSTGTIFDGKISFADGGKFFHGNGTRTFQFMDCEIADLANTRRTMNLTSGKYIFGYNEARTNFFGKLQIQAANLTIAQPFNFTRQEKGDTIYEECNLALNCDGAKGLVFECENAFNDETFLLLTYAVEVANTPICIVNLNGYNQRVGLLGMWTQAFDSTTQWNANMVITSETPATLTILETYRTDVSDGMNTPSQAYPGRINGAASIVLEDKQIINHPTMAKRMRFNCPDSTTSGSLTANGGTIEIMPTATFSNLTALVAAKTGTIKVHTPDIGVATNLLVSVTNSTTAAIEFVGGVTLEADTAFMGNKYLYPGDYVAATSVAIESEGAIPCSYLKGDGILRVRTYGGPKGFMLIVR